MLKIETLPDFDVFLAALKDVRAAAMIVSRVQRAAAGLWGDAEPIGQGATELRIHFGPGYRVYCKEFKGRLLLVMGCSTKRRQQDAIMSALAALETWSKANG